MSCSRDAPLHPGRRAFLRGSFLTGEGRKAAESTRAWGPLPPALTPDLAGKRPCSNCTAPCVDACEPGVIRLHPDGHSLEGTAYLSFEANGCTFCNECSKACPVETEQRPSPVRLGIAVLDRGSCIAWNGVICISCRIACSYDAVRTVGIRPHVVADACTGCGACVGVCPSRALIVAPRRNQV